MLEKARQKKFFFVGANSNKGHEPLHGVSSNKGNMLLHGVFSCSKVIFLWSFVLCFFSCEEQRRIIVPFVPAGNRVVLLEEFTGKGCSNCPKGSREIENLLAVFPDNLVVVSLHAGFFADPQIFSLGQYDFRTDEGEFLINYLSQPIGYPSAVVNRTPFNGEMQISSNAWASAITSEIQKDPAVEFTIHHTFNLSTRELVVTIEGIAKENIEGDIRLSVMITESGIVDAQDDLDAGGIVPNYIHNHVLRDMLTPPEGLSITNSLVVGQTFSQSFTSGLNAAWDSGNMDIIVFVSNVEGNQIPVLQAGKVKI